GRNLSAIVWGCLACTWVSVHPTPPWRFLEQADDDAHRWYCAGADGGFCGQAVLGCSECGTQCLTDDDAQRRYCAVADGRL
ncbi:hypothetical protein C8R44DRAFT_980819, partial [Mycena epipterygia]